MQPIPYLFFNGNCRAAMETYGEIFSHAPDIMPFSAMPEEARADMPGVPADAVMHSAVKIGDGWIYASDDTGTNSSAMAGCNVAVALPDEAETRRVWAALADGAEVRMPLKPEFFAPLFGALTDRFGTRWMIMQETPGN
ncbi:VOC family protein [Aquicoccus sp. G2-2]|uniref:VOC family protein n=1 Tax=Aquicoccus sp. G2-2 TaxID=3092120 RepID=UPI002ADFFEBF|nr:VOC family protein [Aquicoccus sp. G2-2]MEA1113827.1 VOC family protein [Aquicoccus sp. G2-2]